MGGFEITIDCTSCNIEATVSGLRLEVTGADPSDFDTADVQDAVDIEELVERRKKEVFDAIDKGEFIEHYGLELKED